MTWSSQWMQASPQNGSLALGGQLPLTEGNIRAANVSCQQPTLHEQRELLQCLLHIN